MFTTLVLPREGIGARRTHRSGLGPAVLVLVAACHIAVIAILALLIRPAPLPVPPPQPGLQILFAAPPPPAATLTDLAAAALAPPPPPMAAPARLASSQPLTVAADPVAPPSPTRRKTKLPPRMAQAPAAPATPSTKAAPPVARATPSNTEIASLAGWEAHIRQAVQDAAIYPAAARLQRREGRAQVQFDYAQGAVARAALVQSSQVASLDRAALAAVTRAIMPKPPAEIGARTRTMLVWVQFGLTENE